MSSVQCHPLFRCCPAPRAETGDRQPRSAPRPASLCSSYRKAVSVIPCFAAVLLRGLEEELDIREVERARVEAAPPHLDVCHWLWVVCAREQVLEKVAVADDDYAPLRALSEPGAEPPQAPAKAPLLGHGLPGRALHDLLQGYGWAPRAKQLAAGPRRALVGAVHRELNAGLLFEASRLQLSSHIQQLALSCGRQRRVHIAAKESRGGAQVPTAR
mmetsp:Transcript_101643/g.270328  ORF Transcript_101643/g.270328 Transcript_101643/m.270328 type:complete len:215 (-) Transcript_101643:266-910(-)